MAETLRILMLEDNPADVELIQFELQEAGLDFAAKTVTTERDYVRAIQDFCPDLILSDYDLPKYNGALALAEARRRCPDTPFILVTGAVTEDRAIEILTQGAKDYVLKNRLQQRLATAVRRAFAEAEDQRARLKAEAELREAHRTLEQRVRIRTAELEAEIAARQRMENALRQSEERLKKLYQESPIPTFTWQRKGEDFILVDSNRAARQLTQEKVGEFIGRSALKLYKDRPQVLDDMNRCYQERSSVRRELLSQNLAPGRSFAVHYGFIPPDLILVHMDDQTERKRAEEAARRSQKTFYELVERSPFGTYVVDSAFRIAQMNAASLAGTFRNVRPAIGRDFAEAMHILWPEPVAAEIIAAFRHTLDTGEPYYSPRFTNPRHDLPIVESYEWELHRLTLPDGQYGVTCYYFDSTRLREAEAQFRSVLSNSRDVLYRLNVQTGRFEYISPAAEKVVGFSAAELMAQDSEAALAMIHPDDLPAMRAALARLEETGHAEAEYRQRTKNGDYLWISNHMSLIRDDAGRPLYRDGNVRDVTGERRDDDQGLCRDKKRRGRRHRGDRSG